MNLTVKEAFEILEQAGITKNKESIRNWIRNGKIKAQLLSRKEGYRIETDDLLDFMETKLSAQQFENAKAQISNKQEFRRFEWDFELMEGLKIAQDLGVFARKTNNPELEELAEQVHRIIMKSSYNDWFDKGKRKQ